MEREKRVPGRHKERREYKRGWERKDENEKRVNEAV